MGAETAFEVPEPPEMQFRRRERSIARIAARQHGVVARRQLLEIGFSANEIASRLATGRLHEVHRGTYAVGHVVLSRGGRLMAAVFSCGPDALLSHRSAGALWGVLEAFSGPADVSMPRWRRPQPGLRVHQASVPDDERAVRDGIPATSAPRTLLDLSAVLGPHELERAIERAEARRLTDALSLKDLLKRYPGRRGVAKLRVVLADARLDGGIIRSELEERFLEFVARAGLPRPEVNAPVCAGGRWYEVDCLWRRAGLIVELDGYATHGTRAAFERDRSRLRALQAAGWRVFPVTWRQLRQDRRTLRRQLDAAVLRRGRAGSPLHG